MSAPSTGKPIDLAALGEPETKAPLSFAPAAVFYDGPSGKYLIDAGAYFRTCGRKSPVITGVERHFVAGGFDDKEAKILAREAIADAEIDNHVEWSGSLAGHRKGMIHSADGKPMLVLTSPQIVEPRPGPAPVISTMIFQAFPDRVQRDIFTGWLAGGYRAVVSGIHMPAPLLCLASGPNYGKSLLAYIVQKTLGGRSANPHAAWTGSLPWNDNLCGAELLLLDDCEGSTDIRSRVKFGANFKSSIYSGPVDMLKRHNSSMSCRPVWRVMVCCNDNAESLMILPPVNSDLSDKIILLKLEPITPPIDTSSADGRAELQRMIDSELPQLAHHLERFVIPEDLRDSRSGVLAWRHPDLIQDIDSTKPETRLGELLQTALASHQWDDLPRVLTASEIEGRLIAHESPVRDQAKALLGGWSLAAGTYLGRLADSGSEIVKRGDFDARAKVNTYIVARS